MLANRMCKLEVAADTCTRKLSVFVLAVQSSKEYVNYGGRLGSQDLR